MSSTLMKKCIIMDNGWTSKGMDLGFKFILMVATMKVIGRKISMMVKAEFSIQMEITIKVNGEMVNIMDLVDYNQNNSLMKDSGNKILR